MKALFVYAPDTRIKQHPIRFGSGEFTAVTGVFEGTFTRPMPIGGGKFIQPTGKYIYFVEKGALRSCSIYNDGAGHVMQ